MTTTACSNLLSHKNDRSKGQSHADAQKAVKQHIHGIPHCNHFIVHSHANANKEHKHALNCKNKNKVISNAHTHPKIKDTGTVRHVHPGGSKAHQHHKGAR